MSMLDVLGGGGGGSLGYRPKPWSPLERQPVISGAGGGVTEAAATSRQRGAPERMDLNQMAGLQIAEAAGRAPGFVYERPIALADTLARQLTGGSPVEDVSKFVGSIPILGDLIGGAGDALGSGIQFVQALAAGPTMDSLAKGTREGWQDNQVLQSNPLIDILSDAWDFLMPTIGPTEPGSKRQGNPVRDWFSHTGSTWGEFKADAVKRGVTEQDLLDYMEGRKGNLDFGHVSLVSDPMANLALTVIADPVNLAFGLGLASKAARGTGLFLKAVKAGAQAEKVLPPLQSAARVAEGVARESSWKGIASYLGQISRGARFATVSGGGAVGELVPGASRLAELGIAAGQKAVRPWKVYQKAAIVSSAAQAGLMAADQNVEFDANTPLGGFMEGLFSVNQAAWDNQPLSKNGLFSLWSAFHMPVHAAMAATGKVTRSVVTTAIGHDVRVKLTAVLGGPEAVARLGGREALDDLIYHTHANLIINGEIPGFALSPGLRSELSSYSSRVEAVAKNQILRNVIDEMLPRAIAKGRITGAQTVDAFKRWFENRFDEEAVMRGVTYQWDATQAVDRWIEYRTALAPVSRVFAETADTIMGLADTMPLSIEDLAHVRAVWRLDTEGATLVPFESYQRMVGIYPQLLRGKNAGWFQEKLMLRQAVPLKSLQGKIRSIEKDAPTLRELTHEFADAEAKAPVDVPDAVGPIAADGTVSRDWSSEGSATVGVSRWEASKFGGNATVRDAQVARSRPEILEAETVAGEALAQSGFNVDRAHQVLVSQDGQLAPALVVLMPKARLPELRAAAANLGARWGQDTATLSVSGSRLVSLGLRPNGVEFIWELPGKGEAQLQVAVEAVAQRFPGAMIDDTAGLIRIALPKELIPEGLDARLAAVDKVLSEAYPPDLMGETGIIHSKNAAYIETVGKREAGANVSYADAIKEDGPRSKAFDRAYSQRVGAPEGANAGRTADMVGDGLAGGVIRRTTGGAVGAGSRSLSGAEVVGFGKVADAVAGIEEGYLYKAVQPDALKLAARTGIPPVDPKGLTWVDGSAAKRNYFGLESAVGDEAVVRVKTARAGRLRAEGVVGGPQYVNRRLTPREIEVLGADGLWYPLREFMDKPLGEVPPDLAKAYSSVADVVDVPVSPDGSVLIEHMPDDVTLALRAAGDAVGAVGGESEQTLLARLAVLVDESGAIRVGAEEEAKALNLAIEMARTGKGAAVAAQVKFMAERDAAAVEMLNIPVPKYHGSLSDRPVEFKAQMAALERRLKEEYPSYTLKAPPKLALVLEKGQGTILGQALKERTLLGNILFDRGPLSRVGRLYSWLTTPVRNSDMGRAARQAMMNELLPHGATPAQVDEFLQRLEQHSYIGRFGPQEVRAFGGRTSLPQKAINTIAAGDATRGILPAFSEKTVAAIGSDNFARIIDRASNRFMRATEAKIRAGTAGQLERSLNSLYKDIQKTPVGDTSRLVGKTLYHWFRFLLDARWHAMNQVESDILGGMKYGKYATRLEGAQNAKANVATMTHALGRLPKEMPTTAALEEAIKLGDTGWLYARQLEGYVSRSFDIERRGTVLKLLRELPDNDPVLSELRRRFGTADDDIVQEIDNLLYHFDQGKGRELITDTAKQILGPDVLSEPGVAGFVQRIYERNQQAYDDVSHIFRGNPNRTNLERLANSYWLYWPLSYQLKAGKWMFDVLTHKMFGKETNMAGAYLWSRMVDRHKELLVKNPEYAAMFENNQSLWFTAQMMIPITPVDLGVSLSRGPRYVGGALGLFGEYKNAQDPVTALGAVLSIGPLYTIELLKRMNRETGFFTTGTQNLAPVVDTSAPMLPNLGP